MSPSPWPDNDETVRPKLPGTSEDFRVRRPEELRGEFFAGVTNSRNFLTGLKTHPAGPLELDIASLLGRPSVSQLPLASISARAADAQGGMKYGLKHRKMEAALSHKYAEESERTEILSLERCWIEAADNVRREYTFTGPQSVSPLQARLLKDTRLPVQKVVDSFLSRFFPLGYPHSVAEGYLAYSQHRAVQHFASAALSVLSTQSLLFAAGLRPTPAQATIVSWVLKDGMQHIGKLVCSSMGARMDSEPKRWRIFADVMYDIGAGLEVLSPMCPQHFLPVAGMANLAKGMALVSARATRLPVYSSFVKEGNLSDLYAKGEAISTLSNVLGLGVGIHLASNFGASIQGKLLLAPLLSAIHLYSVTQEMRAAPINTLNAQRTAMLVADFMKTGSVSRPAELRSRERLILPVGLHEDAGNVQVGVPLCRAIGTPTKLAKVKQRFQNERFLLSFGEKSTDLVLHQLATGEDAVRGWLLAAHVARLSKDTEHLSGCEGACGAVLEQAYKETEIHLPALLWD